MRDVILTATLNQSFTIKTCGITNTKTLATKQANKRARKYDCMRVVVSHGALIYNGEKYPEKSILHFERHNTLIPCFKAGPWIQVTRGQGNTVRKNYGRK